MPYEPHPKRTLQEGWAVPDHERTRAAWKAWLDFLRTTKAPSEDEAFEADGAYED